LDSVLLASFTAISLWSSVWVRALAAFSAAYVFDLTGSYNAAFIGAGVALVIGVFLVNRLGADTYPVHRHITPQLAAEPAT
jgi:hypothetical protein